MWRGRRPVVAPARSVLLIARELHDVLAHHISLINVQSGAVLHLLDERPERARPALEAVNQASEEALGALRSVLDVLSRGVGEEEVHGEAEAWAPRAPTAGLRDLDGLVRRTRAAGLDVHLAAEGEVWPLPAGVDLAAFRIVQEALTNVVRHAGGGVRATVRLVHGPAELVVQVDDDGNGVPSASGKGLESAFGRRSAVADRQDRRSGRSGRGIVGMRERVHALGGTFAAGPAPGGASASGRGSHCRMGRDDLEGFGARVGATMIRVLLADDQELVRAGFRMILEAEDDIEVVGEASDGDEAVRLARRQRPDIVLMDIRMPGTDGLAATRAITADERLAEVRIVILTTFELDEYVFEAIRSGASGFIRRDRRAAGREPAHGQDPREPGHDQAARPRPDPAGGLRLPVGTGAARLGVGRPASSVGVAVGPKPPRGGRPGGRCGGTMRA
jgi:CheY-like chemotaxis protein